MATRDHGSVTSWAGHGRLAATVDASDHVDIRYTPGGAPRAAYHLHGGVDEAVIFENYTNAGNVVVHENNTAFDWPTIWPHGSTWHAMWVELDSLTDTGTFFESSCTSNCVTDPPPSGGWSIPASTFNRTSVFAVRHLELVFSSVDNSRHLVWAQKAADELSSSVFYSRKCPGNAWTTPVQVRPAQVGFGWQQFEVGRPHLSIDETNQVIHILVPEMSAERDMADGDLIWAHRTWSCPP